MSGDWPVPWWHITWGYVDSRQAVFTPRPDELPDMPDPTPSDILNIAWLKSLDYDEAMRVAAAEGRRFDRDARQRIKDAP